MVGSYLLTQISTVADSPLRRVCSDQHCRTQLMTQISTVADSSPMDHAGHTVKNSAWKAVGRAFANSLANPSGFRVPYLPGTSSIYTSRRFVSDPCSKYRQVLGFRVPHQWGKLPLHFQIAVENPGNPVLTTLNEIHPFGTPFYPVCTPSQYLPLVTHIRPRSSLRTT